MMTRTADTTRVVIMVMIDQGFAASVFENLASQVLGLGGRVPIRSFCSLEAAAIWLEKSCSDVSNAESILDQFRRVRCQS